MTATIVLVLAGLVGAGSVAVQAIRHYRLRARAWPDRLEDLTRPRPRSTFVRGLLAVLSVVVLAAAGAGALKGGPDLGPTWAAFVAGGLLAWACLMVAHWCYSPVLAGAGIAMVVLCLSGLAAGLAALIGPPQSPAPRLAAAVAAWSFSAWLWMWLDRVWRQQRYADGSAFTTTGRMVGLASRCGAAVSVLASLAAAVLISGTAPADGHGRWLPTPAIPILGSIAIVLWLAAVLLGPFRESGRGHRLLATAEIAFVVLCYALRG